MLDLIVEGRIIHCDSPYQIKIYEHGFVIVNGSGKIRAIDDISNLRPTIEALKLHDYTELTLKKGQLLLPGFIDTHIHAPQYPNIGLGYDKPLLEWLDTYTFPLEKQLKSEKSCRKIFNDLVRTTLDNGTTTASYFGSLWNKSNLVLADTIIENGQRALVGKINMTRLAPDDYLETDDDSFENTLQFIKDLKLKGNHLVQPIITPRFALSVDMIMLTKLGIVAKELNLHVQSHVSENREELRMVKELFPDCDNYVSVYDKANLLTSKTVLAHGIHLDDSELKILADRGTSIAHCPDSNTNLKSGLCDVRRLIEKGITVGLGTDVSGGSSPSIIANMKQALVVSTHLSFIKENYKPLNYEEVFYLATLGGAKALAMDDNIGNFEPGKSFDAVIVDFNVPPTNIHEPEKLTAYQLLQKMIYNCDDRNIITVFVDGKAVKNLPH